MNILDNKTITVKVNKFQLKEKRNNINHENRMATLSIPLKLIIYKELFINLIKKISYNYSLNEDDLINEFIERKPKQIRKKRTTKSINYITVYSDYINGKKVFIDEDNIIYENDKNKPIIIGQLNK